MAHVVSVNTGRILAASWAGKPQQTAILKTPVDGPVHVGSLGVDGDEIGDPRFHGGLHKAVYAYPQEDYEFWGRELGRPVPTGMFGENLTTSGLDVNGAVLGELWRVGSVLLSPCEIRTPCATFRTWLGRQGFDTDGWTRRFARAARAGTYLRVLEEGSLQAGDVIRVEHRPAHGVTVQTMFRALVGDRALLTRLLDVEGLPEHAYAAARRQASRERLAGGPPR
ncbi:MAG TPA: MOSC domain-containing protein [Nocardioidaceae bacterium]|nr:MOSC domain-containing protein [Nocardioidaceae bacterium]